jgi:hypothetical protein
MVAPTTPAAWPETTRLLRFPCDDPHNHAGLCGVRPVIGRVGVEDGRLGRLWGRARIHAHLRKTNVQLHRHFHISTPAILRLAVS